MGNEFDEGGDKGAGKAPAGTAVAFEGYGNSPQSLAKTQEDQKLVNTGWLPNNHDALLQGLQVPNGLSDRTLLAQATDRQPGHALADHSKPEMLDGRVETQARTMEVHGHVSQHYQSKVQQWWDSVPRDMYDKATHAGIRVIVVDNAKDIIPNADQIPATGHRATGGETIAQQPMFYDPKSNAMIFAEHPDSTGSQQIRQSKGVQEFESFDEHKANHELGHGLDFAALKHISASKEFDAAYQKGQDRLTTDDHKNWHYFVDPAVDQKTGKVDHQAPKNELIAEIYALTHKPPEKLAGGEINMLRKFSEVVDLMKKNGIVSRDWQPPKLPQ